MLFTPWNFYIVNKVSLFLEINLSKMILWGIESVMCGDNL